MAARKLSLATIRKVALALPGVEEGTSYGTPAFRFRKKLIARLHQDGESLVLKVGNETRDHLLQADPETFFVTDHYRGYPMVLARLDRLSAADLKKLLQRAVLSSSLRSRGVDASSLRTHASAAHGRHERADAARSNEIVCAQDGEASPRP